MWQRAHFQLLRLAKARAKLDFEEGRWLLAARSSGTHTRLGMASFAEYVERVFGYSPRLTAEKVRVAEALERLPATTRALEAAELSWSSARELARVATPETEEEWLTAAQGKTAREVERLVSGHRPGSYPSDEADDSVRRHVVRFEVSGEALATLREAFAKIRRDAAGPLDDDAALLVMARHVLGGPTDEGRASYQVAITVCEKCERGWQQGRGEQTRVGEDVLEMAQCDSQQVGRCGDTHVGALRATQEVPPATRRAVLRRDHGRCRFPGCRHATFVDVHHIEARSEGGAHEPENLITLCSAHHRAVHSGIVIVTGSVREGLDVRHADGSSYGAMASPTTIDLRTKAFQALRGLGFRESDIRRALAATHVGASADLSTLVRACLQTLTHGVFARAS